MVHCGCRGSVFFLLSWGRPDREQGGWRRKKWLSLGKVLRGGGRKGPGLAQVCQCSLVAREEWGQKASSVMSKGKYKVLRSTAYLHQNPG